MNDFARSFGANISKTVSDITPEKVKAHLDGKMLHYMTVAAKFGYSDEDIQEIWDQAKSSDVVDS